MPTKQLGSENAAYAIVFLTCPAVWCLTSKLRKKKRPRALFYGVKSKGDIAIIFF